MKIKQCQNVFDGLSLGSNKKGKTKKRNPIIFLQAENCFFHTDRKRGSDYWEHSCKTVMEPLTAALGSKANFEVYDIMVLERFVVKITCYIFISFLNQNQSYLFVKNMM